MVPGRTGENANGKPQYARRPHQFHDHHTHVGVIQHAHPPRCLPQRHSPRPTSGRSQTPDSPWPARRQHPRATVASPRHRSPRELGRLAHPRPFWRTSHKPRHTGTSVITISAETLTVTPAVDPVTVPSTCTMLAQPCKVAVATLKCTSSKPSSSSRSPSPTGA